MVRATDVEIFNVIIQHEGKKYTNAAADLGGPTKFGITIAAWQTFSGKTTTAETIQNLTLEQARAYYYAMHLRPFDWMVDPIRLLMIDISILRGLLTSIMMLQGAILGVEPDGRVGPITKKAMEQFSPKLATNLLVGARLQHIRERVIANPSQVKWANGWRRRTLEYTQECE